MKRERRRYTNAFKTEVVLEVLKEKYTIAELAEKYKIFPTKIRTRKTKFQATAFSIFRTDPADFLEEKENKATLKKLFICSGWAMWAVLKCMRGN